MVKLANSSTALNHLLPKPIAFNCWKHHLRYVKDMLEVNDSSGISQLNIHDIIQHIGDTNIDFYYGELEPLAISIQIIKQLETIAKLEYNSFSEWVNADGVDFKNLTISDGSNWTIRMGQEAERYVHIHPSRHSKKTFRVKSSTLKTIIAFFYNYGIFDNQITVEKINRVRNKIVKLPSFRSTSTLNAVLRIAEHFLG